MDETALGAAYRLATQACPLGGAGCPSADELAAAARGSLDPERRDALVAVLSTCARCAAVVQMAADFTETEQSRTLPPLGRTRRWVPVALAAGLLVALVPALRLLAPGSQGPERVTRGADPVVHPAPGTRLALPPDELRWPTPAGLSCTVVIRSASADVLLRSATVSDGRLTLTPQLRTQLALGEFLWTAECGERVLGPFAFTVQP